MNTRKKGVAIGTFVLSLAYGLTEYTRQCATDAYQALTTGPSKTLFRGDTTRLSGNKAETKLYISGNLRNNAKAAGGSADEMVLSAAKNIYGSGISTNNGKVVIKDVVYEKGNQRFVIHCSRQTSE